MRILHVDTGPEMRGGQYQVLILHRALRDLGVDQKVLGGPALQSVDRFEATGWRSVRRWAARCDLIHAHDARAHTLAALHRLGRPLVVARRVAFPIGRNPASRWKYRAAGRFVAISQHVASVLEAGGVPPAKVDVIHDAAPDTPLLARAAEKSGKRTRPRSGAFRVLVPNSPDPLKGRELGIEACRLAGMTPLLSANLLEDLPKADVLLYLSRSEGLGSGILLAMLAGVPAVASRIGGIPEVVEHGQTGLLVENDPPKVAAALHRLSADPAWRVEMGRRSRLAALSRFGPERMAKRTAAVYGDVLGQSRGSQ